MRERPSRRSFLAGSGALAVGVGAGCLGRGGKKPSAWLSPDLSIEHPDAHQLATLRAIADTFVPDWDGGPGALEADAVATLVDPDHGLNPYLSELVADLDDWCYLTYGSDFARLGRDDRTRALEQRMGFRGRAIRSAYHQAYDGALALTKLAYFGGLTRTVGLGYIGFPGPSAGYAPESAAGAYRSTDTPLDIPNTSLAGVDSVIAIDGPGALARLALTLYVRHPDPSDLLITLHSPAGTAHTVWERRPGRPGPFLQDVVIDRFTGEPAAGRWRLHLQDNAGAGHGALRFWHLVVRTDLDG